MGREESTEQVNKYGINFYELTKSLTDADVIKVLNEILTEFDGRCTLIKWQPRDSDGNIVYGYEDSLRHCVKTYGSDIEWIFSIDIDEFLFSPSDRPLNYFTDELSRNGHARAIYLQKKFKDRFLCLDKQVIDIEECIEGIDTRLWAPKTMVLADAFDPAVEFNMHCVPVTHGTTHHFDIREFRFNHYNVNEKLLGWMMAFYQTSEPFSFNAEDNSMQQYRNVVHEACKTYGSVQWRDSILRSSMN